MKGLLRKVLVLGSISFFAMTAVYAKHDSTMKADTMHKGKAMWLCTTNASSSSNPNDQKADDMMAKTAKAGSSAFEFAMKNCRDCTKITCTMETRSTM